MSTHRDATHTYSQPTGGRATPAWEAGTATGQPGTITWELGEFENHLVRLARVHEAVLTSTQQSIDAVATTRDAYGMLFGWAIMPFLGEVSDGTVDFAEELADAVDSSRQAIRMTLAAYHDRESDNAAVSNILHAETSRELR